MIYHNLRQCVNDLESKSQLIRISDEVDSNLEIAELHRRVYHSKGPALLFENIKNCRFPAVSNLYGTTDRAEYLFEDCLRKLDYLINLKIDPLEFTKSPLKIFKHIPFLLSGIPRQTYTNRSLIKNSCEASELPQITSWPMDGGSFITLPQVISFPPDDKKLSSANIGMYRIQQTGNHYINNQELGLHYQLHRGIGIHHSSYKKQQKPFKISIAVGGPPAFTLASIFPLPEGLSEVLFSGILGHRAYRYYWHDDYFIPADVDFCITGTIDDSILKPEGPFGDHLGYYSLIHDFPVIKINKIYHRRDAIWHFTVVGRPPQEDSSFGHLIHQMVGALSTNEFPGIKEIHAVDAAGVHPLLIAIGSERYMPFRNRKPEEILTQANHLLGKGQTSLAKFLMIAAEDNLTNLSTKNIPQYINYVLERIDFDKDLHFYTNTTIDTLDYSGSGWNEGSKLVIAVNRDIQRELSINTEIVHKIYQQGIISNYFAKGILVCKLNSFTNYQNAENEIDEFLAILNNLNLNGLAWIVIVDDVEFCIKDWNNFLWISFTRCNPAHDIYGLHSRTKHKHWSCKAPMIFDSRSKPHHAPVLEVDAATSESVDRLISNSPILQKIFQ